MDLLCLATSSYDDPLADEWHPDLRLTVNYLRARGLQVGYRYVAAPQGVDDVAEAPPAVVFVEVNEENRTSLLAFLARLRQAWPDTTVLTGGVPVVLDDRSTSNGRPVVDAHVLGERDVTLVEIVARLGGGDALDGLPGLRTGRGPAGPARRLLPDLDVLGTIARDGVDDLVLRQGPAGREAHLVSSRGCPCRCTFCGVPEFYRLGEGSPWRGRSPGLVVDEMAALGAEHGVRSFVFEDDNFLGPGRGGRGRATAIADEILSRRLDVEFSLCCTLAGLHADTLRHLMKAGLRRIGLSVESTDAESLRLLGKGHRPDQIYPAFRLLERLGLPCDINLIVFGPYATLETVRADLRLLEYVRRSEVLSYSDAFPFNALRAFPWSRVAVRLRREGLLGEGSTSCRFRDPDVGRLASFVAELERSTRITFKHRALVAEVDAATATSLEPLVGALRSWVGLGLLPRYVGEACDLLEDVVPGERREAALAELAARFDAELGPLRALTARAAGG